MARYEASHRHELTAEDMDDFGHLNQARYHHIIGRARRRFLFGPFVPDPMALDHPTPNGHFVLARVELDYHREVVMEDGWVIARAWLERMGSKSITVANDVVRPDGTVAASGLTIMVAWDPEARCAREINAPERAVYSGT
jgi:acyl-CoA thioester hydrolase